MAEPQAGQAPAGQSPRKIWKLYCDDVPLTGPTDATTVLRSDAGPEKHFGWALSPSRDGVLAEKDGRSLLVPWTKVRLIEHAPAEAPALKRAG